MRFLVALALLVAAGSTWVGQQGDPGDQGPKGPTGADAPPTWSLASCPTPSRVTAIDAAGSPTCAPLGTLDTPVLQHIAIPLTRFRAVNLVAGNWTFQMGTDTRELRHIGAAQKVQAPIPMPHGAVLTAVLCDVDQSTANSISLNLALVTQAAAHTLCRSAEVVSATTGARTLSIVAPNVADCTSGGEFVAVDANPTSPSYAAYNLILTTSVDTTDVRGCEATFEVATALP